jgi:hypothetical protein
MCDMPVVLNISLTYDIKIYNTVRHQFIFYKIILYYNSATYFGPISRAIFRLIFEQVACTIDNAFNLRDTKVILTNPCNTRSRKLKTLSIYTPLLQISA